MTKYQPVQDQVVRSAAIPEMFWQLAALGGLAFGAYWLFGFEIALLCVVVFGFALNAMNIVAAATSTNVQIAEVRNLIQAKGNK